MGRPIIDLTGNRFGRLTVIKFANKTYRRNAVWLCECECGQRIEKPANEIRHGKTKSCGCYRIDLKTKLGQYRAMKQNLDKAIINSLRSDCCKAKVLDGNICEKCLRMCNAITKVTMTSNPTCKHGYTLEDAGEWHHECFGIDMIKSAREPVKPPQTLWQRIINKFK